VIAERNLEQLTSAVILNFCLQREQARLEGDVGRLVADIAPMDGRANGIVSILDSARLAALFARSLA
jgi:hypothetical protein